MNRPSRLIALFVVALLIGLGIGRAIFASRQTSPSPSEGSPITSGPGFIARTQEIMATPITVEARADQINQAEQIVFDIFRGIDARMSEWKDSSPLSAINRSAGVTPVPIPADLRALLHRSIDIAQLTDGAFDPTWAALWGLWDFKAEHPAPPSVEAIAERLALIDYRSLDIDDTAGTVFLPRSGMLVGLGGIAKGYALDQAAAALHTAGIYDFLISAGGQIMAGGSHDGRPWRVGVRDPRGDVDDYFARIELHDESASTSGDYERYFIDHGVRYHHVLDPRTGKPSRGVRSVTVVSGDATLADALSTALMILGVERGLAVVEATPGLEALFVDEIGKTHLSSGLEARIEIVHDPHP